MTILELREKRAKAWEATKAFLDSHRNDKGVLRAATRGRMSPSVPWWKPWKRRMYSASLPG